MSSPYLEARRKREQEEKGNPCHFVEDDVMYRNFKAKDDEVKG